MKGTEREAHIKREIKEDIMERTRPMVKEREKKRIFLINIKITKIIMLLLKDIIGKRRKGLQMICKNQVGEILCTCVKMV